MTCAIRSWSLRTLPRFLLPNSSAFAHHVRVQPAASCQRFSIAARRRQQSNIETSTPSSYSNTLDAPPHAGVVAASLSHASEEAAFTATDSLPAITDPPSSESQSAQSPSRPSPTTEQQPQQQQQQQQPDASPDRVVQEPYFVRRTKSNELPVYNLTKGGGNLLMTRVTKVEGDVQVLRRQLVDELCLLEKDVTITGLGRHVLMKGRYKMQIIDFLKKRRF